ncbi:Alpha/Beta hydrolase protein [Mycena olivaceomarginata]|nr:Alpha/Beta hydrolase protein [Mycena olivaceomarginata]
MIILTCIVIVAEAILCARATSASPLQVVTDSGVLYGFVDPSAPAVRQFLGVPFALPPPERTDGFLPRLSPPLHSPSRYELQSFLSSDPSEQKFPVLVWFFGGVSNRVEPIHCTIIQPRGFSALQAHIVVSVNFRATFSASQRRRAPGEESRAAGPAGFARVGPGEHCRGLVVTRRTFVAWGESAGAIASTFSTLPFPMIPLVWGVDHWKSILRAVGGQLGCAVGAGQVDCLRNVAWQDIEALLASNASIPKFCLSLMTARTESRRSAIDTTGTLRSISPPGFSGAYHASELPLLFGTAGKFHGPSTSYENVVGALLQDLWLDFLGIRRVG